MNLVLSLFPGIDLLGRGFEAEGFSVVRGPDLLWGGDIRGFHAPPGKFDGIIGGSPCQDFSVARRNVPPTGEGIELLREFCRVVSEAAPDWFLLENVPSVPTIAVEGYSIQRVDLKASECGGNQRRLRHFQFGSRRGLIVQPERKPPSGAILKAAMASEGKRGGRRSFADFCELQGLPRDFNLPGYSREGKYKAVGNGVPVMMARTIARAIRDATCDPHARSVTNPSLCICGCGREPENRRRMALPACRKRMQRRRRDPAPPVTVRSVTSLDWSRQAADSHSL